MKLPISVVMESLEVGDSVRINNRRTYFTVCGISPNFILAHRGQEYTIIMRYPTKYSYNGIPAGSYVCAPDFWVWGYYDGYRFDDPLWVKEYLQSLESGETEMSLRNRLHITQLHIKSHGASFCAVPDWAWSVSK